jgi:hypothetical protein
MKTYLNTVLGLVLLSTAIWLYYLDHSDKFAIVFAFFAGHFVTKNSGSRPGKASNSSSQP